MVKNSFDLSEMLEAYPEPLTDEVFNQKSMVYDYHIAFLKEKIFTK